MNQQANMAAHYEYEIPEGYEARIEGNKVIIEQKESEDERIRKELVYFIQKEKEHMESKVKPENSPKFMFLIDALAYLERQKEQKPFSSYDMAKCFIEGQDYVIRHPEKFGLRQPAEWSEEDKGMLNCIIATLCEESHGGRESNGKMVTWLENRLKSLRPQPHWKPSEEQMRALENVIKCEVLAGLHVRAEIIQSLLNDLKKL